MTGIERASMIGPYLPMLIVAFLVTVVVTPLVRRVALAADVVDHPDLHRKMHTAPVPYLGGVAVFLGMIAAIAWSYTSSVDVPIAYRPVPMAIVLGMTTIVITGLADDVWGWDPRLKVAGQLVAAAAMAHGSIGTGVAKGFLHGIRMPESVSGFELVDLSALGFEPITLTYCIGTALVAVFVLGGCNAANLIDGLDGLLPGTVAIMAVGLMGIGLLMAAGLDAEKLAIIREALPPDAEGFKGLEGITLAGARIVLCMALLGATLGFLVHNFNPASIYLGDSGSLLLGYGCVVIVLMLGELGQTHLVLAGLIVFGIPIADTMMAIIRRKITGAAMSEGDDQHLHHLLLRRFGSVRHAVLMLYAVGIGLGVLGVALAALTLFAGMWVGIVYLVTLVLFGGVALLATVHAMRVRATRAGPGAVGPPSA